MGASLIRLQRSAVRARKLLIDWAGLSGQIYFEDRVAEYRKLWQSVAAARNGRFTELAADLWQIEIANEKIRILNHELEFDNPVTLGLAGRKTVVHRLLAGAGIAVPAHAVFSLDQLDRARAFVEAHPQGCVIKPAGGYGGKGVTTHVQNSKEARRAAVLASLYDSELLIEAQIPGECYRLLVLEGRLIHAVCRRGPRVTADGRSSIQQLLILENARRKAADEPLLDVDRDCLFTLGYQSLNLQSVPAAGQPVLVKSVNDTARKYVEVRTVYTESVTDVICDAIRRDAEAAARLVGSDFLGVDIITPDPTRPLQDTGGVVNEVNTTPALHHHYDVRREAYPQAAVIVLEALVRRKAGRMAPA
jgi:cyanophycin synthetase